MTDFAVSIENLVASAENLTFQAAAMESVTGLGLRRFEVGGIDKALIRMGLESTTTMAAQISTEGIFEWIKNKITGIGRKVSLVINKIYAKITGADDKVKDLLKRAEKDPNIELPISGKKIALVGAACAAVLGAIAYYIKRSSAKNVDSRIPENEGPIKKAKESLARVFAQTKAEKYARAMEKKRHKALKDKMKLHKEIMSKRAASIGDSRGYTGIANGGKSYLKMISDFFKKLWGMISGFGKRVQGEAQRFNSEAKQFQNNENGGEAKQGIWAKIKNFGRCVSGIFKMVLSWFGAVKPKELSAGDAPADMSIARSASAARADQFSNAKAGGAARQRRLEYLKQKAAQK